MTQPDKQTRPAEALDASADVCHQQFSVPFEFPVHFTRNVFAVDNDLLASVLGRVGEKRRHRAAVYVDSGMPYFSAVTKSSSTTPTLSRALSASCLSNSVCCIFGSVSSV